MLRADGAKNQFLLSPNANTNPKQSNCRIVDSALYSTEHPENASLHDFVKDKNST